MPPETIALIIGFIFILIAVIMENRDHMRLLKKSERAYMKESAIKEHRKGQLTNEDRAFLKREYGEEFLSEVSNSVSQKERQKQIFEDEFLAVRTAVLKRDNYRCVNCRKTGKHLHAHHIVPRSEGGTNDLDNLVTLCERCHSVQDSKGHNLIKDR